MSYLIQTEISNDNDMRNRVSACAAENGCQKDFGIDSDTWMLDWRKVWAAAPGWDEAWEYAIANGNTTPGSDPAVITDEQINSQVQAMMPFTRVSDHAPEEAPGGGNASP